ncbi:hypothetical protein SDC9_155583 [bioreactor metagenome]|uniref:Uncharacterized protein n=1 Tax=bioreactor metagenome TaxID=1076179 RepID=A0A645F1Z6_9ZZZZ
MGCFSDSLENQGDGTFDRVGIGYCQGNAFTKISTHLQDDELTGLARFGDFPRLDLHPEHFLRQSLLR